MLTFKDLQDEVKRRSTHEQGGAQFDIATKNIINASIFRISREALWRVLRRKSTFDTVATYTTGSGGGTFTNGSKNITVSGATFITDNIKIGQRIKLQGDSDYFTIKTITGETTLTIDKNYSGTTISGTGTYSILGQEEYNLPIGAGNRMFLWHEEYGYPYQLNFMTEQSFYSCGASNTTESIPTHYRMWGEDMVIEQLLEASTVSVSSSSASDTTQEITIFGIVSGYPDSETVTLNGTSSSTTTKSFSSVEYIVKNASTEGRVTATGNSGNSTISVIPSGDIMAGLMQRKIQLYPLPNKVFPINIQYYKDPIRLVNDGDVSGLGADFDEAIILLSVSKIKSETSQQEGDRFFAHYKDELRTLKKTNMDKIDWFPSLKRPYAKGSRQPHPNLLYQQVGSNFGHRV